MNAPHNKSAQSDARTARGWPQSLELNRAMGNPISENIKIGTVGELLVQIRLLQFGVQAAPPLKDSGNDLIAVRGESFRGVQVKTTARGNLQWNNLPQHYHILALVDLAGVDENVFLDASRVYLVPRPEVDNVRANDGSLEQYSICQELVDNLFSYERVKL